MRLDARCLRLAAAMAAVLALAGCGAAGGSSQGVDGATGSSGKAKAGATATPKPAGTRLTAGGVVLTRDPEENDSFPLPEGTRGAKKAPSPDDAPAAPRRKAKRATGPEISPGAPSDAEIRRELKEMDRALKELNRVAAAGRSRKGAAQAVTASVRAVISKDGQAHTPVGAPDVVARIIAGGNAIANFPYIWGGGHGSFVDSGYDCSGSVSYALAAAGLLDAPLVSGQLADYGEPGPGKWVTIYANDGHVFMYVAGLRFDTSGRDGPFGSRWQTARRSLEGFRVRHPPGL